MFTKPLIGINADFRGTQKGAPAFTYLASGYYDCITRAGGVPVIIPPIYNVEDPKSVEDDVNNLLSKLDGFMLVGGADLDPRRDGFMLHPTVKPMENRRETFDRMLMKMLADRKMPVFGIGAGMQLLNVTMGGNLFLHLPEDLPNAIPHKDPLDAGHRHSLDISTDSLMERVYGDGEIRVSSRHHMAVDEVADGFRVTARCPDGVIEAIETAGSDWFALGTQFHPESNAASALDVRIFEEFVDGVREQNVAAVRLVA